LSLALGVVGTIVAVGGLMFTWLERRDRLDADEQERRDRVDEIELVRRQVAAIERQTELEEAASEAARAADLHVRHGGRDGLGWSFDLVNAGSGTATSVKAWLINAETGEPISLTKLELAGPLLPGATTERRLTIPVAEAVILEPPPLALMLSWTDTRPRERRDEHPIDL
jgi:hypothetical protein